MIAITLNGTLVDQPRTGVTGNGTPKAMFSVQADGGELPLNFQCISFGATADRAATLTEGDVVLLNGRMTAQSRSMTLVVNTLEVLWKEKEQTDDETKS